MYLELFSYVEQADEDSFVSEYTAKNSVRTLLCASHINCVASAPGLQGHSKLSDKQCGNGPVGRPGKQHKRPYVK